jgi:hypothetical protein
MAPVAAEIIAGLPPTKAMTVQMQNESVETNLGVYSGDDGEGYSLGNESERNNETSKDVRPDIGQPGGFNFFNHDLPIAGTA